MTHVIRHCGSLALGMLDAKLPYKTVLDRSLRALFECKSSEERVVYKKLNSTAR
jgi:hypothetical protein